jgi:hypothetical protein
MGHQLNQKVFFQTGEMTVVLLGWKNARSSGPGMMLFQRHEETLWGFTTEQEKFGQNATLNTISNALQRFRHALNKYHV